MAIITCSICGKEVETELQPGQDNSTFVCEDCQNAKNLEIWKKEKNELDKKEDKNDSELRRLDFLKAKIKDLETE